MIVIDVTKIYSDILGHAGVCYPTKDANGKYIMSITSLEDGLLSEIYELLMSCPKIPHKPKIVKIP